MQDDRIRTIQFPGHFVPEMRQLAAAELIPAATNSEIRVALALYAIEARDNPDLPEFLTLAEIRGQVAAYRERHLRWQRAA